MALSVFDGLASFDMTAGKKLDLSPVLSAIFIQDQSTLGVIGMGSPVADIRTYWNEDSLHAPAVTDGGAGLAVDPAGTGGANGFLTVSVADALRLRVGALLLNEADDKSEIVQVTAIDTATGDLTVSRQYGGTPDEAHLASATWAIIGQPVQEGDESIADISKQRTQFDNYTQIFKQTVKVSGTQEAVASNGMHPGISSEAQAQLMRRAMELGVEVNRAVISSYKNNVVAAGSDAEYRTMGGLRQLLSVAGSNVYGLGAVALTEAAINEAYKRCWDKGGDPSVFIGSSKQNRVFSGLTGQERFRLAPSDRMAGAFVEKYLTEFGKEIALVMDRHVKDSEAFLIDPSKIEYKPLNGRALFTEPLAKIGDALRWQMVAEGTLAVYNSKEAHTLITGIA